MNERTGDFGDVVVGPDGADVTFVMSTGAVIQGGPEASVDGDGVPDLTEALGPNEGDGNADGTPDHQQAHVTSLPANGAESGGPETYLTLAGPSGSSLVDVVTIDPTTVAAPPPPGLALPSGLVSVRPGTLRRCLGSVCRSTCRRRRASPATPSTTRSTRPGRCPAGRVQVFGNRVEITLTDGGVGDADGTANGTIVDPGGPAEVTAEGDHDAPRGHGHRHPGAENARAVLQQRARPVDRRRRGVGALVLSPPDTVLTGEGGSLAALSAPVCAPAHTELHDGPAGWPTGSTARRPRWPSPACPPARRTRWWAVPAPACTASDALSGLARACTGSRTGGNAPTASASSPTRQPPRTTRAIAGR